MLIIPEKAQDNAVSFPRGFQVTANAYNFKGLIFRGVALVLMAQRIPFIVIFILTYCFEQYSLLSSLLSFLTTQH
jgi:hypothetical protein